MTSDASPPATAVLDEVRRLGERTRRLAKAGSWFPVALLAVLLLGSIALYAVPFRQPTELRVSSPYWAGLPDQQRDPIVSYLYWFLGTPVTILLIGGWYRWRARHVGIRIRWVRFAATAIGALAALAVLAAAPVGPSAGSDLAADAPPLTVAAQVGRGFLTPLLAIGLAVIVLGWSERSRGLSLSGVWVVAIAWWQCSQGMGRLTGWMVWVLDGFSGPALGGEVAILGLNRPGPILIVLTLPMLVFAAIRAIGAALRAMRAESTAR